MKWVVTLYHKPMANLDWDDVGRDREDPKFRTEYIVDAETHFDAAVIAYGLYSRYDMEQILSREILEYPSVRDDLQHTIREACRRRCALNPERAGGKYVYFYDDYVAHFMEIEERRN